MCHPYIEIAPTLSNYYSIDDEEIARISSFCWSAEIEFHHLDGPKNLTFDLKYDVLCL